MGGKKSKPAELPDGVGPTAEMHFATPEDRVIHGILERTRWGCPDDRELAEQCGMANDSLRANGYEVSSLCAGETVANWVVLHFLNQCNEQETVYPAKLGRIDAIMNIARVVGHTPTVARCVQSYTKSDKFGRTYTQYFFSSDAGDARSFPVRGLYTVDWLKTLKDEQAVQVSTHLAAVIAATPKPDPAAEAAASAGAGGGGGGPKASDLPPGYDASFEHPGATTTAPPTYSV